MAKRFTTCSYGESVGTVRGELTARDAELLACVGRERVNSTKRARNHLMASRWCPSAESPLASSAQTGPRHPAPIHQRVALLRRGGASRGGRDLDQGLAGEAAGAERGGQRECIRDQVPATSTPVLRPRPGVTFRSVDTPLFPRRGATTATCASIPTRSRDEQQQDVKRGTGDRRRAPQSRPVWLRSPEDDMTHDSQSDRQGASCRCGSHGPSAPPAPWAARP